MIIWITGLSGAGKTAIGTRLYEKMKKENKNVVYLDGDLIREVIGSYGYEREQRFQLAKKISNLCYYLEQQEIDVICSTMSLFKEIHQINREKFKEYYEVFVDVEMNELIKRDQKGLYSGAINNEIKNVVGIDIEYDAPQNPHLVINNNKLDCLEEKVEKIYDLVTGQGDYHGNC